MKKLVLMAGAAILFASCGSKSAEDVKVEDIKDACGCSDAILVVTDDIISFMDGKDAEELSEEDEKTLKGKNEKIQEIMEHCMGELDVKEKDLKDCDSFDKADKNMKTIQEY